MAAFKLHAPELVDAGLEFHFDLCIDPSAAQCDFPGGCNGSIPCEEDVCRDRLLVCTRCQMRVCGACTLYYRFDHLTVHARDALEDPDNEVVFDKLEHVYSACLSWRPSVDRRVACVVFVIPRSRCVSEVTV